MSPPTPHPWERRGYSGEPLACEIDYKNTATQERCGCISGTREGVQSIQYCKLHAQAPAMREALKAIEPWMNKVTEVHASARDAKAKVMAVITQLEKGT